MVLRRLRLFTGATPFIQLGEEAMEAELLAVGVGALLENVRRAVVALGDVAGCTKPIERPNKEALVEARDRFRAAVASYARAIDEATSSKGWTLNTSTDVAPSAVETPSP